VGSWAAQFLQDGGGKVVAVSDFDHTLYNPEGLDIPALRAHHKRSKPPSLAGFLGAQALDKSEVLYVDCDVLVPAAIGGIITRALLSGATLPALRRIAAARAGPAWQFVAHACGGLLTALSKRHVQTRTWIACAASTSWRRPTPP